MFKAIYSYKDDNNKWNNIEVFVYDIKYDKHGYPLFLIYFKNQWLCRSAKFFTPLYDRKGEILNDP